MPKLSPAVITSGPLSALAAALDDLNVFNRMVERLIVPDGVLQELQAGGASSWTTAPFARPSKRRERGI